MTRPERIGTGIGAGLVGAGAGTLAFWWMTANPFLLAVAIGGLVTYVLYRHETER